MIQMESTSSENSPEVPQTDPITALRAYLMVYPEMRIGQVISNMASRKNCDPYFLKDEDLVEGIKMGILSWDDSWSVSKG